MSEPIFEAFVEVNARIDRLDRQLEQARRKTTTTTNRMTDGFKKVRTSVNAVRAGIVGITGAVGIGAFASLTREAIQFSRTLANTSERLGLTTDELQELRFAATQSGVAVNQFDIGFQRFTRRVAEARQGTGELREVIRDLGIDISANRSNVEVFEDFIEVLANTEDASERVRIAFKAFDTEGVGFVQIVQGGAGALAAYRQQAIETGQVLDKDVVRRFNALGAQVERITTSLRNQGRELVASTGFISNLVDSFEGLVTGGNRANIEYARLIQTWQNAPLEELQQRHAIVTASLFGLNEQLRRQQANNGQVNESTLALTRALVAEQAAIQTLIGFQDELNQLQADQEAAENLERQTAFANDLLAVQKKIFEARGDEAAALEAQSQIDENLIALAVKKNILTEEQARQLRAVRAELEEELILREDIARAAGALNLNTLGADVTGRGGAFDPLLDELAKRRDEDLRQAARIEEANERKAESERESSRLRKEGAREAKRLSDEELRRIEREAEARKASLEEFSRAGAAAFQRLVTNGGDAFDQLLQVFLTRFIANAAEAIAGLFDDNKAKGSQVGLGGFLGTIFGLAEGGIVTRPTFAAIAERGPEAVIPLNQLGSLGGGGSNVEIIVNPPVPMTATESQGRTPDLRRIVIAAVANDMASGGATASAAQMRFGLSRQGVIR
jgi:hypothetical protein